MNNLIYVMSSFSKTIDLWNKKLDAFAAEYMDSPWVGMVIFLVLFAFGCFAISGYVKK